MFHKKLWGAVKSVARPVLRAAVRSPLVRMIPGVGTVAAIAGLAAPLIPGIPSYLGGPPAPRAQSRMPPVPGHALSGPSPTLPSLRGMAPPSLRRTAGPMAPSGPIVTTDGGVPTTLPSNQLGVFYRAPRGYVVIYDANRTPYAMLKSAARKAGLWKPAKKPPISVTDWSALKRADRVINKLKKVGKMAQNISNFRTSTTRYKTIPAGHTSKLKHAA